MGLRIGKEFFLRHVLEVSPALLGKIIVTARGNVISRYTITETEAYNGTGDLACHASKGKTARTEVMFREGGVLYMYLIYGIHWMMNIVTSVENDPQAVLIRGTNLISGPGRLTKEIGLDSSCNGESLVESSRIWIEEGPSPRIIQCSPRIGIDYAGEPWISKPWRFFYHPEDLT